MSTPVRRFRRSEPNRRLLHVDLQVLVAAARRLDSEHLQLMSPEQAGDVDLPEGDIGLALRALVPTYLDANAQPGLDAVPQFVVSGLTERGRRVSGLWPEQEQVADALIELLTQAADHVDDEDDAGALRKAGRLLRGVPAAVLADVTAALIRQQTGMS